MSLFSVCGLAIDGLTIPPASAKDEAGEVATAGMSPRFKSMGWMFSDCTGSRT
jgi:hypothetical protein